MERVLTSLSLLSTNAPGGESLRDTIVNILLAVAILGGSYVIMHFFARAMYVRCFDCGTLNARRRSVCRQCAVQLKK